jgi:hypothetical protein
VSLRLPDEVVQRFDMVEAFYYEGRGDGFGFRGPFAGLLDAVRDVVGGLFVWEDKEGWSSGSLAANGSRGRRVQRGQMPFLGSGMEAFLSKRGPWWMTVMPQRKQNGAVISVRRDDVGLSERRGEGER